MVAFSPLLETNHSLQASYRRGSRERILTLQTLRDRPCAAAEKPQQRESPAKWATTTILPVAWTDAGHRDTIAVSTSISNGARRCCRPALPPEAPTACS